MILRMQPMRWIGWLAAVLCLGVFIWLWSLCPADAPHLVDGFRIALLFLVAIVCTVLLVSAKGTPMEIEKELFEAYENGKHRRYTLLFAVNGGAFAVAELLVEKKPFDSSMLTVHEISGGMLLFTAIMCFDILAFGLNMRRKSLLKPPSGPREPSEPAVPSASHWNGLFALPGWIVLGALWLLISGGWFLAGTSDLTATARRAAEPGACTRTAGFAIRR